MIQIRVVLALGALLAGCRAEDAPSRTSCGDGWQELDEACDDGNAACRDGCDAQCRVEPTELLVIDLSREAIGDPSSRFHWEGPSALDTLELGCAGSGFPGRTFVYAPPENGTLILREPGLMWVTSGPSLATCDRLASYALRVRGGESVYLRQEVGYGEAQSIAARFIPERSVGERCDPTGASDSCAAPAICDGGICAEGVDRGCGVNVPLLDLAAPGASGETEIAGTTALSSTHSFPASCGLEDVEQRVHRLVMPYRARVRARAWGPAVEILAAGRGGCRADRLEELACSTSRFTASARLNADLGVIETGTELFFMVGGDPGEYALRVSLDRLPDVGDTCDPGDSRAPCPEGSACVDSGSGHVCESGADAGCGAGIGVIDLEASRAGGVVQLSIDPRLASVPLGAWCRDVFAELGFIAHLRMPFTARVSLSVDEGADVAAFVGACDAVPICDRDLGELAAGTDLWVRVNTTRAIVLRMLLERDLAEGDACDPSRFTDRCPSGTSCAPDGSGGFTCMGAADLGCGAGTRIEPIETLADGSGLYTGSSSTAAGHREMQICDRRLGATLEVVHRWMAPVDGSLVVRTTLDDPTIISVRTAACDASSALACDAGGGGEVRVDGVRAGDVFFVALDALPDGVDYELTALVEEEGSEEICGASVCASDETCMRDSTPECVLEPRPATCGNGLLEPGEECDSGGRFDGSCSGACQVGAYACGM